jgi:hypothetical protein
MMRRAYVVGKYGGDDYYTNWMECEVVDRIEDASFVVWTGGSDVTPSYYGRKAHPTTGSDPSRDRYELEMFKRTQELGLPSVGVCRGSQWICSMAGNGSELYQHVSHPYIHKIMTSTGKTLTCNSTHHQLMKPFALGDKVEILAWAINDKGENLSPYKYCEDDTNLLGDVDPEICYFPGIGLAYQPHPEMLLDCKEEWAQEFIAYCRSLLDKYLDA